MPKNALKTGTKVTVPALVVSVHKVSNRKVVTVEVAHSGHRATFDNSWLPNAKSGDQVLLPAVVNLHMPPRVSVQLDYYGTPVTVAAEDVEPVFPSGLVFRP